MLSQLRVQRNYSDLSESLCKHMVELHGVQVLCLFVLSKVSHFKQREGSTQEY